MNQASQPSYRSKIFQRKPVNYKQATSPPPHLDASFPCPPGDIPSCPPLKRFTRTECNEPNISKKTRYSCCVKAAMTAHKIQVPKEASFSGVSSFSGVFGFTSCQHVYQHDSINDYTIPCNERKISTKQYSCCVRHPGLHISCKYQKKLSFQESRLFLLLRFRVYSPYS